MNFSSEVAYKMASDFVRKEFKLDYETMQDLIQMSVMALWKTKEKFNEEKSKYSTFAYTVMRNECYTYFRKENKHLGQISIYEPISSEDDAIVLIDLMPQEEEQECLYDYEGLIALINKILSGYKGKQQDICKAIIKGHTVSQITTDFKVSRQFIYKVKENFKTDLKAKLKDYDNEVLKIKVKEV